MSKLLTDNIISTLKKKISIEDSGWHNISLMNGWTDAEIESAQYRRILFPGGGGVVYLRGLIVPPTEQDIVVGVLPDEYRPSQTLPFAVSSYPEDAPLQKLHINSNGVIALITQAPGMTRVQWISLACSFLIE